MAKRARKRRPKKPRVLHRKLGRERAWGCQIEHEIVIDPRLCGKAKLEVLIHEWDHWRHRDKTEEHVDTDARMLAQFLWDHNIRIVEEGDTLLPKGPTT